MKMSYAIPHSNGRFYLPSRVREWMQLPRDCRLHGKLVEDVNEVALIASPLPVREWSSCFRLSVHTMHAVGSLDATLDAIRHARLNILHMIAASTSSAGELCVTAIVAHQPARTKRPKRYSVTKTSTSAGDQLKRAGRIELKLEEYLEQRGALSTSRLYAAKTKWGLRRVKVQPLLVLRALSELGPTGNGALTADRNAGDAAEISFSLRNGAIDLNARHATHGRSQGVHTPFAMMHDPAMAKSISLLVTVDPDEYHFRIALLPARPYMRIDIPLRVDLKGAQATSMGITRDLVHACASAECPLNLYYSSSVLIASERPEDSDHRGADAERGAKPTERIRIKLVSDVSRLCCNHEDNPTAAASDKIRQQIIRAVEALEDEQRYVTLDKGSLDGESLAIRPLLAPLVFVATNVKAEMTDEVKQMAEDLFGLLKNLHLRPIFVPVLLGATEAKRQMSDLLDVCPLLVSLYLPEEKMRLSPGASQDYAYAPSSWTTFEEAYMSSLPNRQVFRLIHKKVFPPPHVDQSLWLTFEGRAEFAHALKRLRNRILAAQDTDTWRRGLLDCGNRLADRGMDLERIDGSDPELWLRAQRSVRAEAGSSETSAASDSHERPGPRDGSPDNELVKKGKEAGPRSDLDENRKSEDTPVAG